jgi:two-component system, chemotaxis family, protein-glutamate methylesterase/glutaminase
MSSGNTNLWVTVARGIASDPWIEVVATAVDALNAGAIDFVTKPDAKSPGNLGTFIHELIIKIRIASTSKVGHLKKGYVNKQITVGNTTKGYSRIIAIGASTGGTKAIYEVIRNFPRDMPGIVVVQHMPPVFTAMYAKRLNNSCQMEVKEAQNGDVILPGRVLIAPGDLHMRVNRRGSIFTVECFYGDKVSGHCPSVDVLFSSMAEKVGAKGIGIILIGMGHDGARGLLKMHQTGAFTIGQDASSCIVYGMPKVAQDIGAVSRQVGLKDIPQLVYDISSGK